MPAKIKTNKPKSASVKKKKKPIRYTSPLARKIDLPSHFRFKTVRHPKDGQGIQFRIPTSWKETWGSEDNSLFYPIVPGLEGPSPMGGKLFVRFRYEPVRHATPGAAYGLLMSHRTSLDQKVTQTESGMYMLHFKATHQTEGYHAIDFYWFLALPHPPRTITLASFMFSGVAELFDGPGAPQHSIIEMLEKIIPEAVFDATRIPVVHEAEDSPSRKAKRKEVKKVVKKSSVKKRKSKS